MTAEVGPDRMRAAGRIHPDTGIVADEAAGKLDVRIRRLRGDAGLAGISVSRAAESVVQTHRRQVNIMHPRRWVAGIAGVQEPSSTGMVGRGGDRGVIAGVVADNGATVVGAYRRVHLIGAGSDHVRGRPRRTVGRGDKLYLVVSEPAE